MILTKSINTGSIELIDIKNHKVNSNRQFILTFDDGPSISTTSFLLDILAKHNIKAIFFIIGKLLANSEAALITKRAQREGHIIGNHSFSHPNLSLLPKKKVKEEIERTHNLICELIGDCRYFRPPYRARSEHVNEIINDMGYETILWNVDTLDWKLKKNGQWVQHAINQINNLNNCTILMHDIHQTTIDHIDRLIMYIKSINGYRFTLY